MDIFECILSGANGGVPPQPAVIFNLRIRVATNDATCSLRRYLHGGGCTIENVQLINLCNT